MTQQPRPALTSNAASRTTASEAQTLSDTAGCLRSTPTTPHTARLTRVLAQTLFLFANDQLGFVIMPPAAEMLRPLLRVPRATSRVPPSRSLVIRTVPASARVALARAQPHRALSSSAIRASGAEGNHFDPPSGNLFGVAPGEQYKKEGWEGIWVWGFFGSLLVAAVAYGFKGDTAYVPCIFTLHRFLLHLRRCTCPCGRIVSTLHSRLITP